MTENSVEIVLSRSGTNSRGVTPRVRPSNDDALLEQLALPLTDLLNDHKVDSNDNVNDINRDDGTAVDHDGYDVRYDPYFSFTKNDNRHICWTFGDCGLKNKISNYGATFETYDTCLARTGGNLAMMPKSGIYQIDFNIERLNYSRGNGVGICTSFYQSGNESSGKLWYQQKYHIGWDFGGARIYDNFVPNGLLCGWQNQDSNIFYKSCKFIGDALPYVEKNDIVGLVYNSYKSQLSFKLNGKLLNTKLTNIPNNKILYFFAAKQNYLVKITIMQLKNGIAYRSYDQQGYHGGRRGGRGRSRGDRRRRDRGKYYEKDKDKDKENAKEYTSDIDDEKELQKESDNSANENENENEKHSKLKVNFAE